MLQTVVKTTDHVSQEQRVAQIQPLYLNTVILVERLHRRLLDVIKDEFDTARPFPLWRLHSGPQSSSVDQYSETPPEHLASTVAEAMRRSAVTRNFLKNNLAGR